MKIETRAEGILLGTDDGSGPFVTVGQFEATHPGLRNRMRGYIMRADLGFSDYVGLRDAVIRVGRSVILDEAAAVRWLKSRASMPKSTARNPHGCVGKPAGDKRHG